MPPVLEFAESDLRCKARGAWDSVKMARRAITIPYRSFQFPFDLLLEEFSPVSKLS